MPENIVDFLNKIKSVKGEAFVEGLVAGVELAHNDHEERRTRSGDCPLSQPDRLTAPLTQGRQGRKRRGKAWDGGTIWEIATAPQALRNDREIRLEMTENKKMKRSLSKSDF